MLTWLAAALLASAAGAVSAQDDPPPSAIEHALVEYLCRTVHGPTMIGTEAYHSCYSAQLTALREPFGSDLSKLTRAERRSFDAWCGQMQAAGDRDAYLACINRQLVRLKAQRAAHEKSVEPGPQESEPLAPAESIAAVQPTLPAPEPQPSKLWLILAIGGMIASVAGTAFVLMRDRRTSSACRGCGAAVDGSGDMCANCRHEAADARRRAVAGRAEEERQQAETAQREAERQDEEARREQAHREEALRLAAEDEQRRRDEQERRLHQARTAEPVEQAFDPHTVLGVAPGATPDEIHAAYLQAKAKYDPSQYEHFGSELQAHFKSKAEAVERAYRMLDAFE